MPSAADITNAKTDQAHHNDREPRDILMPFSKPRQELVDRLDVLRCEDSLRRAHQPRLNVPMRLMDRAYFVAEHDDHHLAHIWEMQWAQQVMASGSDVIAEPDWLFSNDGVQHGHLFKNENSKRAQD